MPQEIKCPKCGMKLNSKVEFEKHAKEQHLMSQSELNDVLTGWRYFR